MKLPGFDNTPDDIKSLKGEFEALRNGDADRLNRFRMYREENEQARDGNAAQFSGSSDYDVVRGQRAPKRHSIPLPFGQAMTVKHSYRIAGRLPDVVVDRREETPQERFRSDTMEKMVWGIIRESKGEAEFADAAWDGSQLGASCFSIYWDIKKQMPIFKSLDPSGVLVVRGLDDPFSFQRFYRFWCVPKSTFQAEYRDSIFRGEPVKVGEASSDEVTIVQCSDKNKMIRFALEDGIGLEEGDHNYGFVPYTVIPNIGPQRRIWGWADYEFTRSLVQYLPQLLGREADILRAVANGSYLEKGTGQSPESLNVALQKGGVIPSKRDSSIEPIQPPDVPAFADAHRESVMQYIKMLGFAPDAAWGDGAAGSGSDRGLQMQPLAELSRMKQLNWSVGLSRLFAMAFEMIEGQQVGTARYRGKTKKGSRRSPFNLLIGPDQAPVQEPNDQYNPDSLTEGTDEEFIEVPRDPETLFDGDHDVRFEWQTESQDPSDPAFVMSELNKFQQGAQSLRTTLENLGVESPEDEMNLIEQESERFPWLRQGMIQMLKAQMDNQQGAGGGAPEDVGTGLDSGLGTMLSGSAATDADAGASALNGDVSGPLYGGA